jgi:hypothetical protein
MGWEGVGWIDVGYGQVVSCCEHDSETLGFINAADFVTSQETGGFSRRTLHHGVNVTCSLS